MVVGGISIICKYVESTVVRRILLTVESYCCGKWWHFTRANTALYKDFKMFGAHMDLLYLQKETLVDTQEQEEGRRLDGYRNGIEISYWVPFYSVWKFQL